MGKRDGGNSVCAKLRNAFRKEGLDAPTPAADANVSAKVQVVKMQGLEKHRKPQAAATAAGQGSAEKPRRTYTINQKVEDFIARTKMKLRSPSSVGSHTN